MPAVSEDKQGSEDRFSKTQDSSRPPADDSVTSFLSVCPRFSARSLSMEASSFCGLVILDHESSNPSP
jgi:hypothetical protein